MLFRVLSEIIVCVAASFEKSELWLRNRPTAHLLYHIGDVKILKQKAIERETEDFRPQRSGTIESFFSQQNEKQPVILRIYGNIDEVAETDLTPQIGCCCSKPAQEVLGKDPLFSFDSNESYTENIDISSYLVNTTSYFADMLRRIYSIYPESMRFLLTSHPYLYYLQFGDLSISTILQISMPSSCTQFSKSSSELESMMLNLVVTPELSLEVIPAAGYLALLLRNSQKVYQQWIADQPSLPDSVQRCYFYCVKLSSFFVASGNTYAQLLLGELLGLLGAVASERFKSVSREDSVQPHLTEFDLARVMIKRFFVKDLMGLPKSQIQNRIAFTVQSLLRFLKRQLDTKPLESLTVDRSLLREAKAQEQMLGSSQSTGNDESQGLLNEDNLPQSLQILFTEEELSVISQYWSTEYTLRGDRQRNERTKAFEGISCKNYAKWITKLTMRLLLLCPYETSSDSKHLKRSDSSNSQSKSTPLLTHTSSVSPSDENVLYVFKSLLYPSCADKAAYLLPYMVFFALRYHYQKQYSSENESESSTPRLVIPASEIPFFVSLSDYINTVLKKCDILSENEYRHCCSEILVSLNTLKAWRLQYQVMSGRMKDVAWLGEMLKGFLSLIDRIQVIRVAKILGQYEYALRCVKYHYPNE